MSSGFVLSLHPLTRLRFDDDAGLWCGIRDRQIVLRRLPPGVGEAIRTLAGPGGTERALGDAVFEAGGPSALAVWYYSLHLLSEARGLCYTVTAGDDAIAQLIPMTEQFHPEFSEPSPEQPFVLSQFAYLHRDGSALLLESPLSHARIWLLHPEAAAAIGALSVPGSCTSMQQRVSGLPAPAMRSFLSLLGAAGMLVPADEAGRTQEDREPDLLTWHFADLLFHARSRWGRHDHPTGGTFTLADRVPALPAVKAPMSDQRQPLYVPDLDDARRADPPFTDVLENRRSVRSYGAQPITAAQLGEFLYRSARVKHVVQPDGKRLLYETSVRPYPAGGACYELELYPVVGRAEGLARGFFHYDPRDHCLDEIPDGLAYVEQFFSDSRIPVAEFGERQILIIVAARFRRMSWKYQSMAYAAILKNVGVLFQTMYLVATAMNLAPCALGSGDAELFSRIIGRPFHEESSVGEFMLGSRPSPERVLRESVISVTAPG